MCDVDVMEMEGEPANGYICFHEPYSEAYFECPNCDNVIQAQAKVHIVKRT